MIGIAPARPGPRGFVTAKRDVGAITTRGERARFPKSRITQSRSVRKTIALKSNCWQKRFREFKRVFAPVTRRGRETRLFAPGPRAFKAGILRDSGPRRIHFPTLINMRVIMRDGFTPNPTRNFVMNRMMASNESVLLFFGVLKQYWYCLLWWLRFQIICSWKFKLFSQN